MQRGFFDVEPEIEPRAKTRRPRAALEEPAHAPRRGWIPSDPRLLCKTDIDGLSAARLVPFYLMASYAYYECNDTFMDDQAYDHLCRRLDDEWRLVQHPHKHLVDREDLSATTGYALNFRKLPFIIRHAAGCLLADVSRGTIHDSIRPARRTRATL